MLSNPGKFLDEIKNVDFASFTKEKYEKLK